MRLHTLKHCRLILRSVSLFVVFTQTTMASNSCEQHLSSLKPYHIEDGFKFTEGPVWSKKDKAFIFSDIPANTLYQMDENGNVKTYLKNSGYANGNTFDQDGNLISARHDRKLSLLTPGGNSQIIASRYQHKQLNSPNDVIVSSNGAIWFTDPPFGIQGYGPQKAKEEQGYRGVYKLYKNQLMQADNSFSLPNGLAFSTDEKVLYVAEYSTGWVYQFDVNQQELSNKQPFAKVPVLDNSAPVADGIKVDNKGNVWVAGTNAVGIFNPRGELQCRMAIDSQYVTNLAFGGKDNKVVMITAGDRVLLYQQK